MTSYGKFNEFEIRDIFYIDGTCSDDLSFDLVKWDVHDFPGGGEFCYSIARLVWDEHEEGFDLESVGLRFIKECTPELNKWLLKWCDLKAYELIHKEESED